jgi:hypothetical protein
LPGAAAARAPAAVESLAGPFPRIPGPPPLPNKLRAGNAAPPAAGERAASSERPPPIPADRAAASPPPRPPVPRPPSIERPAEPRQAPPPGVSDAEVNALYAKYVQAKQNLGEEAGPSEYGQLLKTIHAQAPKIMEEHNAKGVDFSIVVKDNQVLIRAKPKP